MTEKCYHFYAEAIDPVTNAQLGLTDGTFARSDSCFEREFVDSLRENIKGYFTSNGLAPSVTVVVKSLTRID